MDDIEYWRQRIDEMREEIEARNRNCGDNTKYIFEYTLTNDEQSIKTIYADTLEDAEKALKMSVTDIDSYDLVKYS